MGRIKSKFEHIQSFLSDIDTRKYNTTVQPWLERVRDIAHDAELIIWLDETNNKRNIYFFYHILAVTINFFKKINHKLNILLLKNMTSISSYANKILF